MAGASLGGFVFGVLGGEATSFEARSVPIATLGAVLLLCLYGLIARRTA
ncbi:MAG: GlsB/YeaQ/YmgE family stress response membrane protein [Actinomycetota bacterium]|nr:GlsB/YeaQ/YmgE family stress response membrane protein [Actinomycetota bacterium]MDQ3496795.1 GlsB/YeaQ/YmgE family stress response membrane protein [Actinomycetota bacterium]